MNNQATYLILLRIHPFTGKVEYCCHGAGSGYWTEDITKGKEYVKAGALKAIATKNKKKVDYVASQRKIKPYTSPFYTNLDEFPDQPFQYEIIQATKTITLDQNTVIKV